MDPIRFAINKPVTVSVGVILIIMAGLISLGQIPIQLTPNVDRPVISVTTTWEGANPQEIENDVIQPQEEKLKTVSGVTKMTSVCQQGEGQVILEFTVETEGDAAFLEVSEKLRQVSAYPENVDEPVVDESDPRDRDYIAWTLLYCTDPDFDIRSMKKYAEDRIKTELERVEGVSEVRVFGGADPEVHVKVDPSRLAQYGISPSGLAAKLRRQNLSLSAGAIQEGKYDVPLRTVGRFEQLDEIRQLVLSDARESVVRVTDVAEVDYDFKEPFGIVRSRGREVLAIPVQQKVGTNVIKIMADLRQRFEFIDQHLLPIEAERRGVNGEFVFEQVYDQTIYISQALTLVRNNLFIGGTLAIIVLLLFLRSIRSTLIVALAIPVSIIGTFVAMVLMGRNINVISLAGLAFAVGMVVDNAIVVLENIDRHRKFGKDGPQAALDGAREVWGAIVASTLTTLVVFIPVLTIREEAGQLFRDIALAICAAVTLSLIVSVMVIPSAATRLLRKRNGTDEPEGAQVREKDDGPVRRGMAAAVVEFVGQRIYNLSGSWTKRLVLIVVIMLASVVGSLLLMPPTSYLPSGNRNLVFSLLFPPPGYNLDQMMKLGSRVEHLLRPFWEAEIGEPSAEALPEIDVFDFATGSMFKIQPPPIEQFFFVGLQNGFMFMGAISADDGDVASTAGLLNNAAGLNPGVRGFAFQMPLFRSGTQGGNGIEVEISGPDLETIEPVAQSLFMQAMQRFRQVSADPGNFDIRRPEVNVVIDTVRASDLNIDNTDLAMAVSMLGDGAIIGEFYQKGDSIDLKLISDQREANDATFVRDIPIATPTGRPVPLSSIADIVRTSAPQQVNRIEERRAIVLAINVPDDIALESAMAMIDQEMIGPMRERGEIPPTVETELAGTAAKLSQVKQALIGKWTGLNAGSLYRLMNSRAILALIVVFLLMSALFESWLYPLVIMISVPLATVGGFLGLAVVHAFVPSQQLDVLTMLGFVILTGVVVNNAILLVHQALNYMRGTAQESAGDAVGKRLAPREAIAASVRTRMRPIFMSTLTSVGGMLPLVLFPGAGSELYRGLGSVVVGGLIVSTFFTLILVPLLLSLVLDLSVKLFGRGVAEAAIK